MKRTVIILLGTLAAIGVQGQVWSFATDTQERGYYNRPYERYEAEPGWCEAAGVFLAPSDDQRDLQSEASHQQALQLQTTADSVSWTVGNAGDGLTLRFSLTDNEQGTGRTSDVAVFAGSEEVGILHLDRWWAWQYCNANYPQNAPLSGNVIIRMRFDEVHTRLSRKIQSGERLTIRKRSNDGVVCTIDFAELESVPEAVPYEAVEGDNKVLFNGQGDIADFIAQHEGRTIYIPEGRWETSKRMYLRNQNNTRLVGAGMWWTEIYYSAPSDNINTYSNRGIEASADNLLVEGFYFNTACRQRYYNQEDSKQVGSGPNFAGLEAAYHAYQDRNYNARAQAYLNVEFIPGLVWRTTGSAALSAYSNRRFTEYKDFGPVQVGVDGGSLNSNAGTTLNLMFNSILTYEHTWIDAHHFKVMAGTEWWRLDGYNLSATTYGFSVPVASSIALGSAGATKDASDGIPQERRGSAFARINYDYKGRYLLAANFRADASDRFVKKHRWGFFPSVNAGWRLSEENWVKEPAGEWLSNAKIRASWGILGNDNIAQYMYMSSYSLSGVSHAFDNGSVGETGAWVAILGNEDLKWEEVNQVDVGLDLGFFNNRLTLTYDYYNRQTRDMLYRGLLCLTGGMSYYFSSDDPANTIPVYFNAGMVENQGHEITIGWHDRKKDFSYGINLNLSMNANLVKQVGDKPGATTIDRGLDASWPLLTRTEDGYAMSMFYGYRVLGIFQNQEEVDRYNQYALDSWRANNPNHPYGYAPNGQPLSADGKEIGIYYQSQNTGVGDLIFDDNGLGRVSPASRKYIGNPWPKLTLGLNVNLAYKGFDLALIFQGAFGFEIMNLIKPYTHMFMSDNTTAAIFTTSCFGKDNTTVTSDPRVGYLNEHNSVIGDGAANRNYSTVSGYLVEKGDYLKLKNISFGYTLPQKYSRKAKMEKLRIYFSAQNLFTITSYSGIDPEIGGSYLMYNIDHQNRYLPSRLYSFGLDISF